eukprot:6474934-Amphidinium_carterae.1
MLLRSQPLIGDLGTGHGVNCKKVEHQVTCRGVRKVEPRLTHRTLPPVRRTIVKACNGGLSRLEMASVSTRTQRDYERRCGRFTAYFGEDVRTDFELKLLEYFDALQEAGFRVGQGTKLLAAVQYTYGHLHMPLMRARRALQGWHRLAPEKQSRPIPFAALVGIAMQLWLQRRKRAALCCLLAGDAYLRPCEVAHLTKDSFVLGTPGLGLGYTYTTMHLFPQDLPGRSKALQCDEAIVLDSLHRQWVYDLLHSELHRMQPHECLLDVSLRQWAGLIKAAAKQLGFQAWGITPHMFRHAGPTHDALQRWRSIDCIKRRGRWLSDRSVDRYRKPQQIAARLKELSGIARELLSAVDLEGPRIMSAGAVPSGRLRSLLHKAAAL